MKRAYYSTTISEFLAASDDAIIGRLTQNSTHSVERPQVDAWLGQIRALRPILAKRTGSLYFEFNIPRMGRRIDVLLILSHVIFVLEFKVGAEEFISAAEEQVWDYALDLKNFHQTSHHQFIAPLLVATESEVAFPAAAFTIDDDHLLRPTKCSLSSLGATIDAILGFCTGPEIPIQEWETGGYQPTPTIIEAAIALYANNSVEEISRSDAGAINLSRTSAEVSRIIEHAREHGRKTIVFVTGVPGAGKTLVGLNIAAKYMDKKKETHSVYLSGNGPLVAILREALARNRVARAKEEGKRLLLGKTRSEVKAIIQNVHHFRDEGLISDGPPVDHVAIFDEAQRAWNKEQTCNFMRRKKKRHDFTQSEPDFLISYMDRQPTWAVVVCLVGGGQEINTGEAGIGEWLRSIQESYPNWVVHISPQLTDSEYAATEEIASLRKNHPLKESTDLHLHVSMRSFRAENVSLLVKQLLDLDPAEARKSFTALKDKYPIVLSRDVQKARQWLRRRARGSERYGIVASSNAERLKPHAIDVKAPVDPVNWFLAGRDDVRSSYYLEDVATEFHVQGLELDWACLTWDADFRHAGSEWDSWSFKGNRWEKIHKAERKMYQKNSYRVLMTRARQGMVLVVPEGNPDDPTRIPEFYDSTYEYLASIGFPTL